MPVILGGLLKSENDTESLIFNKVFSSAVAWASIRQPPFRGVWVVLILAVGTIIVVIFGELEGI